MAVGKKIPACVLYERWRNSGPVEGAGVAGVAGALGAACSESDKAGSKPEGGAAVSCREAQASVGGGAVPRRPHCILFDLDGTLLDTHDLILESMQYATREVLKCTVPDDELMAMVGQPLDTQMQALAHAYGHPNLMITSEAVRSGRAKGLPKYDEAALAAELSRVYRGYNEAIHDERVRTFDGIPEALAALRAAGARLGVVTSKRHELAVRGLKCCGIDDCFQLVLGPDDWPDAKPHPGGVIRAMALMGAVPSQTWYVGDSPFDMQAGNGAGCFTVAALWGMFPRDVLAAQAPDAFCESPADLAALI